jgi:hypothetical protein
MKLQKTQPLPWSDEEKERLRILVLQGKSPHAVARYLGRTTLSVRKIASQLKLPLREVRHKRPVLDRGSQADDGDGI